MVLAKVFLIYALGYGDRYIGFTSFIGYTKGIDQLPWILRRNDGIIMIKR